MKRYVPLIGMLLLAVMLFHLDWPAAIRAWQDVYPLRLAGGVALATVAFLGMLGLRVMRFCRLLVPRREVPRMVVLAATVKSALWGMVTPGRLGDVSRVWMLKVCGVDESEAFAIWIYERGLDVASLMALGLAALVAISVPQAPWWSIIPAYFAILTFGLAIGLPTGRYLVRLGRSGIARLPQRLAKFARLGSRVEEVLRWRSSALLATVAMQACCCFGFTAILASVWPSSSIPGAAAAYAVSSTAAILPISIGGIGLREAGVLGVLGLFGVPQPLALLVSILDGFILPLLILLTTLFVLTLIRSDKKLNAT